MIRILLLSLLFSFSAVAQTPESQEKAILVLDVSGSMWGVIDGQAKIEIAREVVSDLLKTWPENKDLGLVAYGHRQKGDCADIETVIPAQKLDASFFNQKVRSLVPKGKTPMVASIRQAAEALKFSEETATVILISDGEETCEADPCAIAKELEAKGVNFTAHVIGFDLKNAAKEAEQQMKCIAESTGGKFLTADNASELSSALKQAVIAPVIEKPKVEEVKKPIAPTYNLIATAYMTEGAPAIKEGLAWSSYTLKENGEKAEQVSYSFDGEYKTNLPLGKYLVEVKYQTNVVSKIIEITADVQTLKFNLGAGTLKLKAFAVESEQLKDDLSWKVDSLDGEISTYSYKPEPEFSLQPGKYKIKVGWGEAEKALEIEIKPGELSEQSMVMNAGILNAKAFAITGGEQLKDKLSWSVEKLVSSLENKYEQVAYSYKEEPKFRLLAGSYQIKVKWGEAESSQEVVVTSGKATSANLITNGGILKFSVKAPDGTKLREGLSWSIFSKPTGLSEVKKQVTYSYDAEPQFILPAGDYLIEVEAKQGKISSEATVVAGQRKELEATLEKVTP